MKPQSRPGCNSGGGSFAPGWSLYSLPGLFLCPATAAHRPRRDDGQSARATAPGQRRTGGHSRHRGRTEPRNRARVQGHRQAPKQATEPPTAAHRRKQSTAPGTIPPETPINAPQSRPGRGCYPYTTRRQNAPQRRTEPPTEGKPPGVQKRRGGQAHSRHSPGTAPRAKIRAVFCDFSSDFLPFFSALSRSACEFYSRKVESRELIVESRSAMEVGAGLIVGKSVNRSVPRLHPPKVAWSGRRRCTSAGFHRLNSRCPVERSE